MKRIVQSLALGAVVACAVLLLLSSLSVSGADNPRQPSLTGQEPALGAFADRGPVDVPDGMWYDATTGTVRSDVLETDSALVAKGRGIGVDEAEARLAAQQRMNEIVGPAHRLFPEFVGIIWTDGGVLAQFKERAPKEALELLSTAGAKVDYEFVKYSTVELEHLQADLGKSLTGMGITDFAVALDPAGQRIIASVSTAEKASTADGTAVSRQSIAPPCPPSSPTPMSTFRS